MSSTQYARSADGTNIAYRVLDGHGPDLLVIPGWVSHVDAAYEDVLSRRYHESLSRFSRVILFDRRGTGASDRFDPKQLPTLDRRLDDVLAVLEAVGSTSVYLMGISEGGPLAIMLAATRPDIVSGLIMYATFAHATFDLGWPATIGKTVGEVADIVEARWSEGFPGLDVWAPSLASFPEAQDIYARFTRAAASPAAARAVLEMSFDIDARPLLETVHVPTLVVHRRDDHAVTLPLGQELADGIADARFVVLEGEDHLPFVGNVEDLVVEIEEFVTGIRSSPSLDRSLATVLFTDIVGSTASLATVGDQRWSATLELHDQMIADTALRYRGSVIKSTGDGALVVFDGPARAVHCALDLIKALGSVGIPIRAGVHTGEIERRDGDVAGLAVHVASRVGDTASRGEVRVSRTTRDLVAGSRLTFSDCGDHELKGLDESWRLYAASN